MFVFAFKQVISHFWAKYSILQLKRTFFTEKRNVEKFSLGYFRLHFKIIDKTILQLSSTRMYRTQNEKKVHFLYLDLSIYLKEGTYLVIRIISTWVLFLVIVVE